MADGARIDLGDFVITFSSEGLPVVKSQAGHFVKTTDRVIAVTKLLRQESAKLTPEMRRQAQQLVKTAASSDKVKNNMKGLAQEMRKVTRSTAAANKEQSRFARIATTVGASYLTYNLFARSLRLVKDTIAGITAAGVRFNATMESSRLGIASMITSSQALVGVNGALLTGAEKFAKAQALAKSETEKLRIAGLATVATTQQLVEGYQQAVGPLSRAGVELKDIAGVTTKIVQAAGALGMPMHQINEEIRSIAAGTITYHSRVAKTLGITNAMVNQWKASGTFVENLNKKLQAFTIAGERAFYTWQGITSNMEEVVDLLAGTVTKQTFFEPMKQSILSVLESLLDIKKTINGEFTGAELSNRFLPQIEKLKEGFRTWGEVIEEAMDPEAIEKLLDTIAAGIKVIGFLAQTALTAGKNIEITVGAMIAASSISKMWTRHMLLATDALGETTSWFTRAGTAAKSFGAAFRVMVPTLLAVALAIGAVYKAKELSDLTDYAKQAREAASAAHDLMAKHKVLGKELEQKREIFKQYTDALKAAGGQLRKQQEAVVLLKESFPGLYKQYQQGALDLKHLTEETKAQIAAQKELQAVIRSDALEKARQSLEAYVNLARMATKEAKVQTTAGGVLQMLGLEAREGTAKEFIDSVIQKLNELLILKGQFPELAGAVDSAFTLIGNQLQTMAENNIPGAQEKLEAFNRIMASTGGFAKSTAADLETLSYGFDRAQEAMEGYSQKALEAAMKKYGFDVFKDRDAMFAAVENRLEFLIGLEKKSAAQNAEVNKLLLAKKNIMDEINKAQEKITKKAEKAAEKLLKDIEAAYEKEVKAAEKLGKEKLKEDKKYFDEAQKLAKKHADFLLELQELEANNARDTNAIKLAELEKYLAKYRDMLKKGAITQEEFDRLAAAKRVEINKTSLQKMLEDWADLSKGWEDIAKNFLENLQSEFAGTIKKVFEGAEDAWDGLWESFKNLAYQAIAAVATRLASGLVARIILNVMGSGGGGSVVSSLFGGGSGGFNMPNMSGMGNWVGMGGLGAGAADMMNGYAGSLYAFNEGAGMAGNAMGAGTAGSALGGVAGIAGALYSAYSLYQLYQNGPGGMEGAGQGAMTGAMGGMAAGMAYGAMTGSSIGPWGAIIGALIGALAGGLGGGGGDSEDRMKDAEDFQERARKILAGKGTQEDYMEAIKSGHRSDNLIGGQAMEELYMASKQKGLLDWWAPAPGQLVPPRRDYSPEEWKRYQIYGGAEEGEMGSLAFMELFGGGGKGGWQGADQKDIQKAMEGLDEETIDKLGSSLTTLKGLATEWGVSIEDLLGPLIDADLADEDWKEALEGLSAATLVQNAADAERERGLNELAIAQNSVMRSISLMAGWNDMEADGKAELIAQLQKDAGRRDELMQASARLKEVEEQLTGAHELSEEEVEALAQEYADLTEKLGLNDTAAADAATAAHDFADVMINEVIPALREAMDLGGGGGDNNNNNNNNNNDADGHQGAWIRAYHQGGELAAQKAHAGRWLGYREVNFTGLEEERVLSHKEIANMGGPARVDMMAHGMADGMDGYMPQPSEGGGGPTYINFEINAAPGMSEQAIGAEIERRLVKIFPKQVTKNRAHIQRTVETTKRNFK